MRLDDETKNKIIADYVDCGNYTAVAKKYGVSRQTVMKIVKSDSVINEKLHRKKEENVKNVIEYMGSKSEAVCELLDLYLKDLMSPEKRKKATIAQIATAMGILIDKFTVQSVSNEENSGVVMLAEVAEDE